MSATPWRGRAAFDRSQRAGAPRPLGSDAEVSERLDAWQAAVRADDSLGPALRHRETLAARPVEASEPERFDLGPVRPVLEARGIRALYGHQARALDALEGGSDVVLATPTASGKSLVYNLPALAAARAEPEARALYLFPLKALSQDQRKGFEADAAALARATGGEAARVEVYDGDTPPSRRRRIRERPPQVLITTPDMLHAGLLPHHAGWERFWRGLRLVVVDELHTYRGIFGSQVAQVLRRLDRVARHHGARPRFVCASATVANPGELARALTGREPEVVASDGAARPARRVELFNPVGSSPYTAAARLFRLAVGRGLRTIAFTKARRVTELMHTWIVEAAPELAPYVCGYRAGFLPEERRAIERRLFTGELLGVVSTSALEMGIDVGGLDVCILVGYPGSQIATWQRAGRVGRAREGAIALVAQPDALDQYLVAHPGTFLGGAFERAVLDPANPEIRAAHAPCAAAEVPLREGEPWLEGPGAAEAVARLEADGALLRSATGRECFAARRRPHREVSLRDPGASYAIQEEADPGERPRHVGSVGAANVFTECHEGAIYLHGGRQYLVTKLELDERKVTVRPTRAAWYTRALAEKETEILSRERARPAGNFRLLQGRVKVTTRVHAYERRRVRGQDLLSTEKLDLPPTSFETTALWLEMPDEVPDAVAEKGGHAMGAIHALEHAALSLFPLFALCDRFDVAGISYTRHPQAGRAAVFFYDGHPGGVGIVPALFDRVEELLEATRELIRACDCEEGCPACIQSPKCGNGNRPLDKRGAVQVLELLLGRVPLRAPTTAGAAAAAAAEAEDEAADASARAAPSPPPRVVVFDLETQRSAEDVGGWHNAHLMRVSVAVAWDAVAGRFEHYGEADVPKLLETLAAADLVVGFNARRFDYRVLRGYTDADLARLPTFDLLDAVHAQLGFRLSLAHLGQETLGTPKSADGLAALRWWKEGRVEEIRAYCQQDVALVRDLFEYARREGFLLFRTRRGERVRLPLPVSLEELVESARADGAA